MHRVHLGEAVCFKERQRMLSNSSAAAVHPQAKHSSDLCSAGGPAALTQRAAVQKKAAGSPISSETNHYVCLSFNMHNGWEQFSDDSNYKQGPCQEIMENSSDGTQGELTWTETLAYHKRRLYSSCTKQEVQGPQTFKNIYLHEAGVRSLIRDTSDTSTWKAFLIYFRCNNISG